MSCRGALLIWRSVCQKPRAACADSRGFLSRTRTSQRCCETCSCSLSSWAKRTACSDCARCFERLMARGSGTTCQLRKQGSAAWRTQQPADSSAEQIRALKSQKKAHARQDQTASAIFQRCSQSGANQTLHVELWARIRRLPLHLAYSTSSASVRIPHHLEKVGHLIRVLRCFVSRSPSGWFGHRISIQAL